MTARANSPPRSRRLSLCSPGSTGNRCERYPFLQQITGRTSLSVRPIIETKLRLFCRILGSFSLFVVCCSQGRETVLQSRRLTVNSQTNENLAFFFKIYKYLLAPLMFNLSVLSLWVSTKLRTQSGFVFE